MDLRSEFITAGDDDDGLAQVQDHTITGFDSGSLEGVIQVRNIFGELFDDAKDTVTGAAEDVAGGIANGFDEAADTFKNEFSGT